MLIFSTFLMAIFLMITFFFAFIPYLTRKTESFGVTIPEESFNEPEVKKIREFYRNSVIIAGFLIVIPLVIFLIKFPVVAFSLSGIFIIFFEIIVFLGFYVRGHFKMKKLKEEKKWMEGKKEFIVAATDIDGQNLPSPLWFMTYILVIALTLGIGFIFYDKIPDKVIIHWDASLNPDKWVNKSYFLILFPVLMQLFMIFVFILTYFIIVRARQQIDPANPEESRRKNIIFKRTWANFTIFSGIFMLFVFLLMQVSFIIQLSPEILTGIILGITGIIVLASIYISVRVGQGGSRIKLSEKKEKNVILRDDDKYWKLGVFYFNPDDPAVFVEKRFGIGWTNNWARPLSWVLLIGLLVLMGVIIAISFVGWR
ncbi:MAG: DUF5808 domain-containing protein [Brevinematales bacterium]